MVSQGTLGGVSKCPSTGYIETFLGQCVLLKNERLHISENDHIVLKYTPLDAVGETGANWDTFIICRPGADDNRVRDSKQSFKLGIIFVIVTRAFNK